MGSRDGYDYVRQHYDVDVEVGQRVVVDGTLGVVLPGFDDQYIHFTPDGQRHMKAHPTWRVEYTSRERSDV